MDFCPVRRKFQYRLCLKKIILYLTVIPDWIKREIIQDKSILKDHPTILQYLVGQKADGKQVVKVFLRKELEEEIKRFKKCCNVSNGIEFEIINVSKKTESILKRIERIRTCERDAQPIDMSTKKSLYEVIQTHGEKIYACYSNVIGIGISPVRCEGETIKNEPCIVLFCLDKNFIPFGESQLPSSIDKFPCDFREDFVKFGTCPRNCLSPIFPETGCSIGRPSVDSSGSVGFMVELKTPKQNNDCGFVSASHVALECFEELYNQNCLLSKHQLANDLHNIVHPSWQDNNKTNNAIGEVVESFCGHHGDKKIGLDFALITNNFKKDGGR